MSLSDIFQKYPAMKNAHECIRESRPFEYFYQGDKFAQSWAQTLLIKSNMEILAGTNLAALDQLFEEAATIQAAYQLKNELQRLTEPVYARLFLDRQYDKQYILSLQDAVSTHVAFLTLEGCWQLNPATLKDPLVNAWLKLWQTKMEEQNSQQAEHRRAILVDYHPFHVRSFEQAAEDYLFRFGETSALSIAVLGVLPFSPLITLKELLAISKMLVLLSPLFRLVQDTRFDPNEHLNLGIFAVAAETGVSIQIARKQLLDGAYPLEKLTDNICQLGEYYFAQTANKLDLLVNSHQCSALEQLGQALLNIAEALTYNWKSHE